MEEPVVVDVLNDEHKVEENALTKPLLEVSVSFGRFENDLLSWEKWSTFSPNKYLEEVEKYATPGSVAQKRAYFEAHYKKIADRKTRLLEQEREMEFNTTVSNELNGGGDLMGHNERADSESETSNHHVSVEEVDRNTTMIGEVSSVYQEVVKDDVESNVECESSPDGEKEEPEGKFDCVGSDSETSKQEEVVVKEVETPPPVESRTTKEPPQKLVNKVSAVSKVKQQILKPNRLKESKKTTPVVKERNSASVKKKPVSSTTKAAQIATPKLSKTTPGPTTPATRSSVPRSSINKGSNSSLRSRNPSSVESKKVAPKSLHMSLSLGTPNSDPSSGIGIRRSFIMEKMADKDIVKRAFKTFQNSFNQMKSSPQEERSSAPKMVPARERETTKISTSVAAKKETEGMHKVSGTIRGTDNRTARVAPSQKLDGTTNAKVIGRTSLQSKSKVVPSQKVEEKFNARAGGRTNLLSKSKVC
ncbi:protein WVD2-like 7 isoform X2 [Benincasa hispida]|uniref:protein WVD2-like 7 isoform X2 n=1 Tax=Benincasa hispida TaxID=102211 RepID=UPI0018FFB452|nr:protein WVD2-like 7 isoform X2 [Benincasa hispida]